MEEKPGAERSADSPGDSFEPPPLNEEFLEALPGGIAYVDTEFRVRRANQAACAILGLSFDALTRRYTQDFAPETIREDATPFPVEEYPISLALATGETQPPRTIGVRRPDGRVAWAVFTAMPLKNDRGELRGAVATFIDISERKRTEENLKYSRERYRRLVSSLPVGIVMHSGGKFIFANPAAAEIFDCEIEDLIGRRIFDFYHPDSLESARTYNDRLMNREIDMTPLREEKIVQSDGRALDVELRGIRLYPDEPLIMATIMDISERKKNEQSIRYLAYHDSLTGLGNRARLNEAVQEQDRRLQAGEGTLAILFMDLDRFKLINDTLGHSAGDWVIRQVASRISSATPERAVLCRQGGDEFIIVLPDPREDETRELADRILRLLRAPIDYRGDEYFVSASIGVALYPEDGKDGESLLKNADAALYAAKDRGGDTRAFAAHLRRRRSETELNLNSRMHRALENGEFCLFYQPILGADGCPRRWEALLRWPRPDGSYLPAAGFVPLAEETGLIMQLDRWVLERACHEIQAFPTQTQADTVAVNVSPRHFDSPDFPEAIAGILERTGLGPERLVLESTERTLIRDLKQTAAVFQQLADVGVRISLDDFGVGYTSLGYLTRLPISSIKIDRSLVEHSTNSGSGAKIVAAIVALGRSLQIEVVGEGIETEGQRDFLVDLNCDGLQGYFLGRPMQADQVPEFLESLNGC